MRRFESLGTGLSLTGAVVVIFSFFMPWVDFDCNTAHDMVVSGYSAASSGTPRFMEPQTLLFLNLLVGIGVAILACVKLVTPSSLRRGLAWAGRAGGVIVVGNTSIHLYLALSKLVHDYGDRSLDRYLHFDTGLALQVVGALALAVGGAFVTAESATMEATEPESPDAGRRADGGAGSRAVVAIVVVCRSCGSEAAPDAQFCHACGRKFELG